jgi:hypothetical protein
MLAIGNAFMYCYHTIGDIFSRPRVIMALFLFLIECLVAAALALALSTIVLQYLDLNFWGMFLIGLVMAIFLVAIYALYQLLKVRATVIHLNLVDQNGQRVKIPALAGIALRYTFQRLAPWGKSIGEHLVLPLMIRFQESYTVACRRLKAIIAGGYLRFDPRTIAVRGLTLPFCIPILLIATGLATWLGFNFASGLVVPFIRRVQATGFALLIFLAIVWLPLALSAVKIANYQADLLSVELSDQPDYLPELLANTLGRRS